MQILSTIYQLSETAVSLIEATLPTVPAELLWQNGASEEQIEAVEQEIARSAHRLVISILVGRLGFETEIIEACQ